MLIASTALALTVTLLNPIGAAIGFLLFCCLLAVIIILGKWILSYIPGVPAPVILAVGIILFMVLIVMFLNWVGIADGISLH